jgi:transcriptional regulator with XRE-family HTH domain
MCAAGAHLGNSMNPGPDMTDGTSFGLRLRTSRQERGLSQVALAGKEISTGYLSRLESGARLPTERVIVYLADRLGHHQSHPDLAAEIWRILAEELEKSGRPGADRD